METQIPTLRVAANQIVARCPHCNGNLTKETPPTRVIEPFTPHWMCGLSSSQSPTYG